MKLLEWKVKFMARKVKRRDSTAQVVVGILIFIAAIYSTLFDIAQEFESPLRYILYGILFAIGVYLIFEFADGEI